MTRIAAGHPKVAASPGAAPALALLDLRNRAGHGVPRAVWHGAGAALTPWQSLAHG